MKTVNPIYIFTMLLLMVMAISSCSEDAGYSIDETTDQVLVQDSATKDGKILKKTSARKKASFKAAPKKRGYKLAPPAENSGPRVLPNRRGEHLEP